MGIWVEPRVKARSSYVRDECAFMKWRDENEKQMIEIKFPDGSVKNL